jgi:TolB protein
MADGQRLLFHSDRDGDLDLFVLHLVNGETQQLTDAPGRDFQASPSPDGIRIAFTSERDGDREIFIMETDGTHVIQITRNEAEDMMPAWSPDGEWLAFVSDRDGDREIYVMRRDGTCPRRVTRNEGDDIFPAWRPEQNGLGPPDTAIGFRSKPRTAGPSPPWPGWGWTPSLSSNSWIASGPSGTTGFTRSWWSGTDRWCSRRTSPATRGHGQDRGTGPQGRHLAWHRSDLPILDP